MSAFIACLAVVLALAALAFLALAGWVILIRRDYADPFL